MCLKEKFNNLSVFPIQENDSFTFSSSGRSKSDERGVGIWLVVPEFIIDENPQIFQLEIGVLQFGIL